MDDRNVCEQVHTVHIYLFKFTELTYAIDSFSDLKYFIIYLFHDQKLNTKLS